MTVSADDVATWVREHGPRLVLFARQWVASRADAEDVLQDAFVRFWPRRGRARDPLAYLYQCVRRTAMNWRRSAERRARHEAQADAQLLFRTPAEEAELAELAALAQAALEGLPVEQREIVVLRIWGQLTFRAIAQVLGIPSPTARSRYRYALAALRKRLPEETEP
jgi:RNA polymerase sigma-70 factor (ECF subfamily)